MRKTFTFLIALMALCVSSWAQLPEENHNLALGTHGIGEIVTIPELEGVVFHNSYEEAPLPESAYTQGDYSYVRVKVTDRGWTDPAYYWQYELAGIWCMNNGEDEIHLTRYEFDEYGSPIKQHNYTITITVAGGMVEVGTWEPWCSTETPDATVLKDTTIHYGEYYYKQGVYTECPIENFVGFRYVLYCNEINGEMVKSWYCVSPGDITVESSNTDVVTVEWNEYGNYHTLTGLKRGTATITVSAAAVIDPMNSEPKHVAKSVQYNVTVTGDAGPNIGFYQDYEPLTEMTLAASETPYYWPVIRDDMYDLFSGTLNVTSSNPAVATIDDPTSNEVHFTFQSYGTTTITATVPGTETTEEATASFTLTYEDPNATDMYFTDYEGNIIDHMDVGTDEYGNPVYPYNNPGNYYTGVRLVIRKHSTGEYLYWATVDIAPEDLSVVQINYSSQDSEGKYIEFECLDLGETDIVATFGGDTWDEIGGYWVYSPAEARLHINYVNTYRKEATIHFAYDYEEGTSFSQTDGDCGHRGGYSIPAFQVWMVDETSGNTVYYFGDDPLPLNVTVSDESLAEVTYNENSHFITYFPKAYGTATISAVFDGNETYGPCAAAFTFSFNKNETPMAECALVDKNGDPVTSIVATEGDLIDAPHLARVDGEDLCYTYLAMATTTNRSRWRLKPETGHWDYFYPKQVGLDTIVFTYYRESYFDDRATEHYEYWDQAIEVRVPVVIMPYITPMISDAETVMNLNPEGNASMSFGKTENDTYNSAEGQLEIKSVVTAANLKLALDSMARGTKDWNDLLPGATTFNVNPGKGKIKIECKTVAGYELKVLVANQGTATISQVDMDVAEINYNVNQVTTVLVYLAATGGSPAPQRRAPQAKLDEPNAIIKSITVSPQFDIEAKQDPDNAGLYYSTFFNSTQKYALPNDGTEAFVATISGDDMNLKKVAEGGQVIPANTALILKSTSASVVLTPTDDAAVTISDPNILHGTDTEIAAPANCYVLSGHSTDNSVTGVGFYQFSGTIPAHKAYATISGGAAYAPKKLRFVFNGEQTTTGVENVQGDKVQCTKVIRDGQLYLMYKDTMYNVQGQIVK